jgi:hypothetical protein
MIYFSKFKTVAEVFIHNFEALHRWRPQMCVPQRMPDAARYFVAQCIDDVESISKLCVNEPERRSGNELAFADNSVLVLPDRIYQDGEFQIQVALGEESLIHLADLRCRIEWLAQQSRTEALFARAEDLLKALGGLLRSRGSDESFEKKVCYQAEQLNRVLGHAFRDGGCCPCLARSWFAMVQRARELGFVLEISPEATAVLV